VGIGAMGLASGSRVFAVLPLLFVLIGFALKLWRALKQDWQLGLLTAVVLLLIPLALHLTWILNRLTPLYGGRFVTAYAYLLVFCLSLLVLVRLITVYELGFINRLVTRIEPLLVGDPDKPQPVVGFSHYPKFMLHDYVSWPIEVNLPRLLSTEAFTEFRQVDSLMLRSEMLHSDEGLCVLLFLPSQSRPHGGLVGAALARLRGGIPRGSECGDRA